MPRRLTTLADAQAFAQETGGQIIRDAAHASPVPSLDVAFQIADALGGDLIAGGTKIERPAPRPIEPAPKPDPLEGLAGDIRTLLSGLASISGAQAQAVEAAGQKIAEIATIEAPAPIDAGPAIEAAAARIEAALMAQARAMQAQADALKVLAARIQPPKVEANISMPDRARPSYAVDIERDRNGMIRDLVIRPLVN